MIFTLAWRALVANPVRSFVLGLGFGLGVAVMATLLGVAEVVLAQARAPAIVGGGHLFLTNTNAPLSSARWLLSGALRARPLDRQIAAASPALRANLVLLRRGKAVAVRARGGVPSLERAVGDPETAPVRAWVDAPGDRAWASPDPGDVLRAMDRFHRIPDVPLRATSWAEWLYFNGRAREARFYLTVFAGPARPDGRRVAGVRLQLDRAGRRSAYSQADDIDAARVLADAPDLAIGGSHVRLEGLRYRISLELPEEAATTQTIKGELFVDAVPGRALPPFTIRGAGGWQTGYTVPVMAGALAGWLDVGGTRIVLDGGRAYHDHNWGFWRGVSWRWGQVQSGDLSFVYGRVYPPADAADPERLPGFLGVLGPDGPLGYSANVTIDEEDDPSTRRPRRIVVRGRGAALDITMTLAIEDVIATRMTDASVGGGMQFLQVRASYHVTGRVGERPIEFTAAGSAETFRGQ